MCSVQTYCLFRSQAQGQDRQSQTRSLFLPHQRPRLLLRLSPLPSLPPPGALAPRVSSWSAGVRPLLETSAKDLCWILAWQDLCRRWRVVGPTSSGRGLQDPVRNLAPTWPAPLAATSSSSGHQLL